MRNLIYFITVVFTFASCSREELDTIPAENAAIETPVKEPVNVQPSTAMRVAFEEIKSSILTGKSKSSQDDVLCFQFIYPITVEYSDESQITVDDYSHLLEILLNEKPQKHLIGIGFPFEVTLKADSSIKKINTEEDFKSLIETCGYDEIDYTYVINSVSSCFEITYPLDLIINGNVKTFKSQDQAQTYFSNNWTSSSTVSISYPFRATMTSSGDNISIANDFEMINLIKNTCSIH